MTNKIFDLAPLTLCFILLTHPFISAQDKSVGKKEIERPAKCDVKNIDEFVSKTFDSYDVSSNITEDIKLIKIEGDGKTTPVRIKNCKGEELGKDAALLQFTSLMERATQQSENIRTLQNLQKLAQESLKKCSMNQKEKASKSIEKVGEALNEMIKQTKTQFEVIQKQISYVKTFKGSIY